MKREFSAGGLVFKTKAPKDKRQKTKDLLWLVCQHSQHKGWVFPKGLIGDTKAGESKEETAIREVKEETGIDASLIQPLAPVKYFYSWEGDKRFKTVYYFLMRHTGGDIADHDHEMSTVEWLPTDEVAKRLTYKSDKEAFTEALKLMPL